MKLEYVASGTSYMRLTNPAVWNSSSCREKINTVLQAFFPKDPNSIHTFSLLYNAFTEERFGERLQEYIHSVDKLHCDSGGLQMITLAHKIKQNQNMGDLKEDVYRNQAQWADIGMCFDEIPVKTITKIDPKTGKVIGSDRNDTTLRWFDKPNLKQYARDTANNIKKQLEIFEETNSKCKPFLICQGNSAETYLEWINTVLEIVPAEKLGGVAMGAAALGTGQLEDIMRAFFASQVPIRDENGKLHLHILGVGSVTRLIPYLIFLKSGLYGDVHISYDSTTHTRSVETGLYFIRGKINAQGKLAPHPGRTEKFSRDFNNQYQILLSNITECYDLGIDANEFHKIMNTPSIKYLDEHGSLDKWIETRTAAVCGSIKNFMVEVEEWIEDDEKLKANALRRYGNGMAMAIESLFNVKDINDFNDWLNTKEFVDGFKSVRIGDIPLDPDEPQGLEALFG